MSNIGLNLSRVILELITDIMQSVYYSFNIIKSISSHLFKLYFSVIFILIISCQILGNYLLNMNVLQCQLSNLGLILSRVIFKLKTDKKMRFDSIILLLFCIFVRTQAGFYGLMIFVKFKYCCDFKIINHSLN